LPDDADKNTRSGSPDDTLTGADLYLSQHLKPGVYSNLPLSFLDSRVDFASLTPSQIGALMAPDGSASTTSSEIELLQKPMPTLPPAIMEPPTPVVPLPQAAQPYDPERLLFEEEVKSRSVKKEKPSHALEFIQSLLVALLLAIVIRYFAFEAFKIPTSSMEPTLLGDVEYGDHVAVNKLAYKLSVPHRWDIVVFKKPGENRNLIKRCVGLPGDELEVAGGEVFNKGKLLRKPWGLMDQFWNPYFAQSEFREAKVNRNWSIKGEPRFSQFSLDLEGPAEMHYVPWQRQVRNGVVESATINDTYLRLPLLANAVSPSGARFQPTISDFYVVEDLDRGTQDRGLYSPVNDEKIPDKSPDWPRYYAKGGNSFWQLGNYDVPDLRLDMSFRVNSPSGSMVINIAEGKGDTRKVRKLLIPFGRQGVVIEDGLGNRLAVNTAKMTPLMLGSSYDVTFCVIDGRAAFFLSGKLIDSLEFDVPHEVRRGNEIYLELSQDAAISIRSISIFRDIFYTPRSETFRIGAEKYFMMGDNSPNSNDSRSFGEVSRDALVGRGFLIFWPLSRIRYFKGGE